MKYCFDEVVDRHNTDSVKWDYFARYAGKEEILPMWVADMDFRAPAPVVEALIKRAQHGIYGYAELSDSCFFAVAGWLKRRHGWSINTEWIIFCPGVVPAVYLLIRAVTMPGDKVIVQSPVYNHFFGAIKSADCIISNNPLKLDNGRYFIDFDDLEQKAKEARVMILCSPHNPGGILWSEDVLRQIGEICIKNNILVISDEIHSDLVLYGQKHVPYASLSEEMAMNSVTAVAPSKTFNLAGLQASYIIAPNPELAAVFRNMMERNAINRPNIFAITATEAAYNHGEKWLDQLLLYLEDNHRLIQKYITEYIPRLRVIEAQATFLAWIDCRGLGLSPGELKLFIEDSAGLGLNQGYIFGQGGEGFVRMNLGCPRALIEKALDKLKNAVNNLHG